MSDAFHTESSTPDKIFMRLKLVLKKSDDELFKNETNLSETEDVEADRQVDAREQHTSDKLRSAVRDQIV